MSGAVIEDDRPVYDEDHQHARETVRAFVDEHTRPNAERWAAQGKVDKWLCTEAGNAGILGFSIPEEYGGPGIVDFRFNAVIGEEFHARPRSANLARFSA